MAAPRVIPTLFYPRRGVIRQVYGVALAELRDFVGGESGVAEDLPTMFAERRGRAGGFGLGRAPGRGHLHLADTSFDRVLDGLEEADGGKVRILEDGFQRMHRHDRNIRTLQQLAPFGRGAAEEEAADLLVDFVDMLVPRRVVGEARLLKEFLLANRL